VGIITNHSYLDNPTFRGMRQSLMRTFNEIYILDLHGNSLKKETCPDGSKDENVFDIRQGVAIALFIKQKDKKGCAVFQTDQYGLRETKYGWLDANDFKLDNYRKLRPESPWYFFVPRNTGKIKNYLDWKAIQDIFPVNVTGIVTARDGLAIDFDKNSLQTKILMFRNENVDDHTIEKAYGVKDNYQWKIGAQREAFRKISDWENYFTNILYRPFDIRHIYYQENVVFRTRRDVMHHMLEDNLSFCFMRQFSGDMDYNHFLVSKHMVDNRTFFSSKVLFSKHPCIYTRGKYQKKCMFNQ